MSGTAAPRKPRRGPRRISEDYLERAALHYLGRYTSSTENFRRVLLRKVARAAHAHGDDPAAGAAMVEALVVRFRQAGYLDDRRYAEARARKLFDRGDSLRAIGAKLRQKGVGAGDAAHAIAALETEERVADRDGLDLRAACVFAKKRRIGPWRKGEGRGAAGPEETKGPEAAKKASERELAALARAGFDYSLARRVVEAEDARDLEAEAAAG